MIDREKVLKGLECCIDQNNECRDCPYFNRVHFYPDCQETMMRSVSELLKEDEAIINDYIEKTGRIPKSWYKEVVA